MTYDQMRKDYERIRDAEKSRIVDEWKVANGYDDLLDAYSEAVAEADPQVAKLRERCRVAAQTLIEAIGAEGPEDVESAAARAAQEIVQLRERVAELEENPKYRELEARLAEAAERCAMNIRRTDPDGVIDGDQVIEELEAIRQLLYSAPAPATEGE